MSVIGLGIGRARAALITLALVVPLMFVAQATTGAGRAEASCPAYNTPFTGTLVLSGTTYASETSDPNTCNDDNIYQGSFRSQVYGWKVTLIFWDSVHNNVSMSPGSDTTASSTLYIKFGGYIPDRMVLCVEKTGFGKYCGWGSNYTWDPTNYVLSYANSGANTYF